MGPLKMNTIKFARFIKLNVCRHRRALAFGTVMVAWALVLIARRENNVRYVSGDMEHVKSQRVWEYVSDFSNMVKLNPTIKKFTVTHEFSNNKQWNYTVEYEEHLSQLPFVTNRIVGDFVVDESESIHAIKSVHRTCFARIYCLNTESEMQFQDVSRGTGTRVVETIKFECPWLLTRFCMNEVMYQRQEIFGRLQAVFAHTKH